MRNLLLSTTAVIALSALLGFAGSAQAQSTSVPPSQAQGVTSPAQEVVKPGEMAAPPEQVAKPEQVATPEQVVQPEKVAPPAQAATPEPVTKPEQSTAQTGEKTSPLTTPEHQRQADEAMNSTPGRNGKAEPGAQTEKVAPPTQAAAPEQVVQPEKVAPPAQAATPGPVTKPEQSAAKPDQKKSPLATQEHQRQADEAMNSTPGRGGKAEPGAQTETPDPRLTGPVLVNGALNVPGAPENSQTVPAKFSERNDRIDKLPIMAMPIGLSDAQKQSIVASAAKVNAPVSKINAKITEELPSTVTLHDLPQDADMPGVKYLRLEDRILLVRVPTNIVVGEIVN